MYIKVRVIADSKKDNIEETGPLRFTVHVKEPRERGLANAKLLAILGVKFPDRRIRIISGHHSPSKLLAIDDDE